MHFPLLLTPLGWVVMGAAGYVVYRAGKKSGRKEAEQSEKKEAKASAS
jgi:hypothetical protein